MSAGGMGQSGHFYLCVKSRFTVVFKQKFQVLYVLTIFAMLWVCAPKFPILLAQNVNIEKEKKKCQHLSTMARSVLTGKQTFQTQF